MKLPTAMMKLAQHIIESGDFDPIMLEDQYRSALVRILRKSGLSALRMRPPSSHRASRARSHQSHGGASVQHCRRAPNQTASGAQSEQIRSPTRGAETQQRLIISLVCTAGFEVIRFPEQKASQ
jgi:non-homologous end joining protein Ku